MLRLCSRKIDLRVFCMNEALLLNDIDEESGSEFFKSLYTYLMHSRSLAAAADELKVHRNTLLYRLRRVSEITGLDLADDGMVFPMLLSYQILRYRLRIEELPVG
jgi:DNA-binding PucR family transcriptional regulator